jgi:hypothetical protein
MFTQAKAAEAIKAKKSRLPRDRKDYFIIQCLLAKQRDKTINLKQFRESQPELKDAIGYNGWMKLVTKDPRIQKAFETKAWRKHGNYAEKQVDPPPKPGKYLGQEGDQYVNMCACKMHKLLVQNTSFWCDKCHGNVNVWGDQKRADDALKTLIASNNNQENFVWPKKSEEFKASSSWELIGPIDVTICTTRVMPEQVCI